jgi:fumarylacetoacetate (FAA) hydrolase
MTGEESMKLVSYLELPVDTESPQVKLGALLGEDCVVDLAVAQTWAQGARGFRGRELPTRTADLIHNWEEMTAHLDALLAELPGSECIQLKGAGRQPVARPRQEVLLIAPLPSALSLRDFTGSYNHASAVAQHHHHALPEEWSDAPTFAYGNPYTIIGPDQVVALPWRDAALDYEFGVACVIGKPGRDILAAHALEYIAGLTIVGNWVARDAEALERRLGVGPSRSKDFAVSLGPALVTLDELTDRLLGHEGERNYDLGMIARVNGQVRSQSNLKNLSFTFGQMIARASEGITLYPGEVFGSGAVGGGSLLAQGASASDDWLKPGDRVELEVEYLGVLRAQIVEAD